MKKLLLGLAVLVGSVGTAAAFSPSQQSQLATAGYTPASPQPWNYRYTKTVGTCVITVTESGVKYDVKSTGNYKTEIWPVSASHLIAAANLVESQCTSP